MSLRLINLQQAKERLRSLRPRLRAPAPMRSPVRRPARSNSLQPRNAKSFLIGSLYVALVFSLSTLSSIGSIKTAFGAETEIHWAEKNSQAPITIAADHAYRWREGSYDVWVLEGACLINQDTTYARSGRAVLWIDRDGAETGKPTKVIAYLERDVQINTGKAGKLQDQSWFGRFHSTGDVKVNAPVAVGTPREKTLPVYQHALARFRGQQTGAVQPVQYTRSEVVPEVIQSLPVGTRRILVSPRTSAGLHYDVLPNRDGGETIANVTSGMVLTVDGLPSVQGVEVGSIQLAADRAVIWTQGDASFLQGDAVQADDMPLEVYLEGNIEFRQGARVIRAERMYYDVRNRVGIIIDADLRSPVPDYRGMVRLKAAVMRQLDEGRFVAHGGLVTTSRLGFPRYYFKSGTIEFTDVQTPQIDPVTGQPELDNNLDPVVDHQYLATSRNNTVEIGGTPVLFWPTMATDLKKPTFYINDFDLGRDDIFGAQVRFGFDAYQVLGIRDAPKGTEWDFDLDYLDKRGLGYGTTYQYQLDSLLGIGGPPEPSLWSRPAAVTGSFDAWAIDDHGLDNLGLGRRAITPEQDYRGRLLWRHRHQLSRGFTFTAEAGLNSDRNFLEEYYEQEWDQWKDQSTGVELKQVLSNQSWSVTSDVRVNDFFTTTEWLPRADHFLIGQSLLGDRLTWFEHTSIGYARMKVDPMPTDPTDASMWKPLPYEAPVEGERFATRHELDMPFEAGPVKVVPYALGEFAHWGEDLTGADLQRFYYQTGVRTSLPFWSVDPMVQSDLWNLNGLAHKITFETDFFFAEADQDVDRLPLYDAIDDHSTNAFRRAFAVNTFGLPPGFPAAPGVPTRFDPRNFLNRSNIGGWATSPTTEVVDDMTALRAGVRQRWQTKRGAPGNEHILDWITFDTNITWFPKKDRDNFGQDFGLADYDFQWHLGDRVSLVSDGLFDFFGSGLRTMSVGAFLNRPDRGNIYLGYRSIAGPVSSDVVSANYAYRMTEKWVVTAGLTADLSNSGSVGQGFSITRIGESFLVTLGATSDSSKDNVSFSLLVEPRFLPSNRVSRAHHIDIAPAGEVGLE